MPPFPGQCLLTFWDISRITRNPFFHSQNSSSLNKKLYGYLRWRALHKVGFAPWWWGVRGVYLEILSWRVRPIYAFFFWDLNSGPTPWATPPALFFVMGFFEIGSHELFTLAGFKPQSSYLHLQRIWDYRDASRCPGQCILDRTPPCNISFSTVL
jgi:hypothetical protein